MSAAPKIAAKDLSNESQESGISKRMEITEKARYNGARRLELHCLGSNISMICVSLELIALSLYMAIMNPPTALMPILNLVSIWLSVCAMAVSIVITMSDFSLRADRLRSCARSIKRIRDKLLLTNDAGTQDLIWSEYYDVLDKHEPHSYLDFKKAEYDLKPNSERPPFLTMLHLLPATLSYLVVTAAPMIFLAVALSVGH